MGEIMPQLVVCESCGELLYKGKDIKPPDEIISAHNGKCPKCGKDLSYIPINVDVKPAR